MAELNQQKPVTPGYGYVEDKEFSNFGQFGLNQNVRLIGFTHVEATGKDLTGGEALEIQFLIDEDSEPQKFNIFPVTKITYTDVKTKEQFEINSFEECKDKPQQAAWRKEVDRLSHFVVSILEAFQPKEKVQAALARPFDDFKDYISVAASLLPKNFENIYLDMFMQYRWQTTEVKDENGEPTGEEKVYLEIPRKSSQQGKWLVPHVEAVGSWKLNKLDPDSTDNNERKALWYEDEVGNVHPFVRSGYFIKSNWAMSLKERNGEFEGSSNPLNSAVNAAQDEQKSDW